MDTKIESAHDLADAVRDYLSAAGPREQIESAGLLDLYVALDAYHEAHDSRPSFAREPLTAQRIASRQVEHRHTQQP